MLWNANYSDELIYPNPSNGAVNIAFSLAQTERIDLSIFDESGRLVRRLLSGNLVQAGQFQILWDGRDRGGNTVPGGVYFWKILGESGGSATGKLILQN